MRMICATGLSASELRTSPLALGYTADPTPRSRERQAWFGAPSGIRAQTTVVPVADLRSDAAGADLEARRPWLARMPLVRARRLRGSDKHHARRCGAPSGMDAAARREFPRDRKTADPWSRLAARSPPERSSLSPVGMVRRVGARAQLVPARHG
jgi:hypothetical protein